MASYQILYWQDLPAQIRAEDDDGEVQFELDQRFQALIDEVATERGVVGTDAYLDGWNWGDLLEREGTAQQVVDALKAELEAKLPADN